jgi:hypothetical protein
MMFRQLTVLPSSRDYHYTNRLLYLFNIDGEVTTNIKLKVAVA